MKQNDMPDILRTPDYIRIETEEGGQTELLGETKVCFQDIIISVKKEQNSIHFSLQADKTPVKRIWMIWNGFIPEEALVLGDHWERGYGDLGWKKAEEGAILPWYFLINEGEITVGYGVKVQPSALCFWKMEKSRLSLCMDVRCGGEGVILNGRKLEIAEAVMIREKQKNTFETVEKFCSVMSPSPLECKEAVYGGNNWYYAYGESSENDILKDAEYIAELATGLKNRPYMVIDDGWQSNHRNDYNGGPWRCGNKKFPDMQKLAKKMKNLGVKPGIWIRLLMDESDGIPDSWRLKRNRQFLDPSVPQVRLYLQENVKRLKEWGYQLIKHDFSTWDMFGLWGFQMGSHITEEGWYFRDRSRTSAEIVKDFYKAILEASEGMLILGCNCMGHLGAGLMHINRTGDDTSGVEWERTKKMGINTLAFRMPQQGHFYEADADCAGITEKIPWDKNRQWVDLLSLSGTPLFVSVRPGTLSIDQKKELTLAFQRASHKRDRTVPLDWMTKSCPEQWKTDDTLMQYHWKE